MSGDHNQYQRDKENISYMYTHFLTKPKTYGCDPNEFTEPCKHFLTGITNKSAAECPYCEIDNWKTRYSNAMDVNADLRAKLAEVGAAFEKSEEHYQALLKSALYALEYACDMTKPDDMSGCGCPICSSIKEIKECLK